MTKEVAIESVYLAVTGGQLTEDVNVKRVDIEAYFSACMHEAFGMAKREEWLQLWRSARSGLANYQNSSQNYFTETLQLSEDTDICKWYSEINKPLILDAPLYEVIGDPMPVKVATPGMIPYISSLSSAPIYWHEQGDVFKIFFSKKPSGNITLRYIPDIYALKWEKELPGTEEVIRKCIDDSTTFFLQKRVANDAKINAADEIRNA